jgi:hypothetical protein
MQTLTHVGLIWANGPRPSKFLIQDYQTTKSLVTNLTLPAI